MKKRILGCDPGSKNFGIALTEYDTETKRLRVVANHLLRYPVNDIVNFNQARAAFLKEFSSWVALKPNGIVVERFQTRGFGGALIEKVGIMLGLISGIAPSIPVKVTTASTWKNRFNRRFDVDLKELYGSAGVKAHQLDAVLMSVFGLEVGGCGTIDYDYRDLIKQTCDTVRRPRIKD